MTTSTFDLNTASNANGKKAKRVGALLAVAMVSSVAALSAISPPVEAGTMVCRTRMRGTGYDYLVCDYD